MRSVSPGGGMRGCGNYVTNANAFLFVTFAMKGPPVLSHKALTMIDHPQLSMMGMDELRVAAAQVVFVRSNS